MTTSTTAETYIIEKGERFCFPWTSHAYQMIALTDFDLYAATADFLAAQDARGTLDYGVGAFIVHLETQNIAERERDHTKLDYFRLLGLISPTHAERAIDGEAAVRDLVTH